MPVLNPDSLADSDLLLELGRGSKSAFDILYNRYWKKVFNIAYKRVGDKEIAEDITQDIFVQLWTRGRETLIIDLPAYFFVAARNGVFKRMVKEDKYSDLPDDVHKMTYPFDSADSKMLHREFLASFDRLIENLPEQQRIIFKLRFNESLTSQQIAEKLQISPKTVRNHIGRALASLKSEVVLFQLLLLLVNK